jgi:hypothetical protein
VYTDRRILPTAFPPRRCDLLRQTLFPDRPGCARPTDFRQSALGLLSVQADRAILELVHAHDLFVFNVQIIHRTMYVARFVV